MYGDLPINSSAAGGPAGGNYMPNPWNHMLNEQRRRNSMELMEYADMYNPRTRALATQAGRAFSGASTSAQLDEWMNRTRAGFFARQGAQMVQGVLGSGSFTDMMYGTQQMVGGSGFRMSINGASSMLMGGGMATDVISQRMFNRLSSHYFDNRGLGISQRTLGRDPTELARVMQIVGASGQLAGLEPYQFGKLSVAERMKNLYSDLRNSGRTSDASSVLNVVRQIESGKMSNRAATSLVESFADNAKQSGNKALAQMTKDSVLSTEMGWREVPDATKKIQNANKDFMRLQDALKDMLGNIEDIAVLPTAFRLTGIRSDGPNAFARQRAAVERMRHDAGALGIGASEYLNRVSGMGALYGQALGSAGFGAVFASRYAPDAIAASKASQGVYGRTGIGRSYSAEAIAQEHAKDVGDLSRESGGYLATQLTANLSFNERLRQDKAGQSRVRGLLNRFGKAAPGAEKDAAVGAMLAELRGLTEYNIDPAILRDSMGTNEQALLADTLSSAAANTTSLNYNRRAAELGSSGKNRLGANFSNKAGGVLYKLDRILGQDVTQDVLEALQKGDMTAVAGILNNKGYAAAFHASGTSAAELLGDITSLSAGDTAGLGNNLASLRNQLDITGERSNTTSYKQSLDTRTAAAFTMMSEAMTGGTRTASETLGKVAARLFTTGGVMPDITSTDIAAYAAASNTGGNGAVLQFNKDTMSVNMTEANLKYWAGQKGFMSALGISTPEELANIAKSYGGMTQIQSAMDQAGYYSVGDTVTDKAGKVTAGVRYFSEGQSDRIAEHMKQNAQQLYFQRLGIDVDAETAAKLAAGKDIDPKKLEQIRSAERTSLRKLGKVSGSDFYKLNSAQKRSQLTVEGQRAQFIKDAIYGEDAEKASKALGLLQSGALSESEAFDVYKALKKDAKGSTNLKDQLSKMNIDVSDWDNASYKSVLAGLEKIAGTSSGSNPAVAASSGGPGTIPAMTVQNMTILSPPSYR